jgi:hypothetical protein
MSAISCAESVVRSDGSAVEIAIMAERDLNTP